MSESSGAEEPYADVRETHAGVVLLLGELAYKLKKPLTLPFLDFSTPERRRAACEREVELNRRLAPDVYLGTTSLERDEGPPEPLVMMRRMPASRRLSRIVADGGGTEEVRAIARLAAQFHSRADRGAAIAAEGRRDQVRARWRHNLAEAERLPDAPIPADLLDRIRARAEHYLAGREEVFDARIAQGKVLDGHGDLLADDIFCLTDGPRVLDCLDFDDRLRWLDQIDDVACLAMDLLRLGRPDLAAQLLGDYREYGGDEPPSSLVHHYIAYRAFMRAKVTAMRAQHPLAVRAVTSSEDAVGLSRLALAHLDTATVRLVLVGGMPGSGKSTLADFLGRRLGLDVVASDTTRKELAGLDPRTPAAARFEEGIYTRGWTERTYAEMLHRARLLLARGESVILDATWRDPAQRTAARDLARDVCAELVQLRCEAPPELAAERLCGRPGASDADRPIAAAMRAREEGWPDSVRIDTGDLLAQSVDAAAAAVLTDGAAGRHEPPRPRPM